MAEISGTDATKFIASSGGENSQVHNLVFLDGSTLSSHRLFDTNTAVILNTTEYPRPPNQSPYYPYYEDQRNDDTITRWLVYEIVKEDTNKDERKDRKDLRVIAVSDANGNNYVEILSRVNGLYGINMIEDGQLVVIYEEGGIRKASSLDLVNRAVTVTQNLTEIDPEIQ